MLKKKQVITMVSIAVISFLIGTTFNVLTVVSDGGNPFDALWEAIYGLQSGMGSLNVSLTSRIEDLEGQITLLQTDIDTLQTQIDSLTASNLELQSQVQSLNQTVVDLQSKMEYDLFQSGLLLELPYPAAYGAGGSTPFYPPNQDAFLLSLDLDQGTPGNQQSVFVYKGTTITITGEFQMWGDPAAIRQLFFIYSWTPSWPPHGYTHALYNGIPGVYPGTGKQSFSFDLTVPNTFGVYYLYLGTEAHHSMYSAIDQFEYPMWIPYAIIVVGS